MTFCTHDNVFVYLYTLNNASKSIITMTPYCPLAISCLVTITPFYLLIVTIMAVLPPPIGSF